MENREQALLKRQGRLIVIVVVLIITTLVSLVYAFVQQGIAKENAELAVALEQKLKDTEEQARHQADIAAKLAADANARMLEAMARAMEKK